VYQEFICYHMCIRSLYVIVKSHNISRVICYCYHMYQEFMISPNKKTWIIIIIICYHMYQEFICYCYHMYQEFICFYNCTGGGTTAGRDVVLIHQRTVSRGSVAGVWEMSRLRYFIRWAHAPSIIIIIIIIINKNAPTNAVLQFSSGVWSTSLNWWS
jgi:hypothetical protein